MKYICAKCKTELNLSNYGGYVVNKNKDLCPKCWREYTLIKSEHNQKLRKWWGNG